MSVIDQAVKPIEKRLKELRPLHEEYLKLETFSQQMKGLFDSAPAKLKKAAPGKVTHTSTQQSNGRMGHGETMKQVREIVARHPEGISVGEIIKEGKLSASYTYAVVKRLVERGEFQRHSKLIYPRRVQAKRKRPTVTVGNKA